MNAAMETLLKNAACRGAFRLKDDVIEPLVAGRSDLNGAAAKTKAIWASMGNVLSDAGMMIAKRDEGLSVASAKGGIILETSGAINLGILRAAVQDEVVVLPPAMEVGQPQNATGLWGLARWIEQIETRRALLVTAGETTYRIWAEKGKFGLPFDHSPAELAKSLISAEADGLPISLSYTSWGEQDAAEIMHLPISLFAEQFSNDGEWVTFNSDRFFGLPCDTSLAKVAGLYCLIQQLQAWSADHLFEVAIIDKTGIREVVARSPNAESIEFNKNVLHQIEHAPSTE